MGQSVVLALAGDTGMRVVESDRPGLGGSGILEMDLLEASADDLGRTLSSLGASVVVNCTGLTSGSAEEMAVANVEVVARLLAGIERMAVRPRLVHIGSAAEYGTAPEGVLVREDAVAAPLGAYAATKLAATRLVGEAVARGEVDALVLRVFNAVGPRMPETSLPGAAVQRLRRAVAAGEATIEMGPLQTVRDFVDVRDIGAAVVAACRPGAPAGGPAPAAPVINVGTGRPHTSRELVESLARRLDFRGAITERAAGSERSANVPWMVADVSLAARVLGWRAVHDLDSIADLVVGSEAAEGR